MYLLEAEEGGHAHVYAAYFKKIFHVSPWTTIQKSALTGRLNIWIILHISFKPVYIL